MFRKRLRNIYLAFGVSFIVTIVISIIYLQRFSALQKMNTELEYSYHIKNTIQKIQTSLIEAESSQRAYLITGDKKQLMPLKITQQNILAEIENLKALTVQIPEQQEVIKKLREVVSLRYQILYRAIDAENGADYVLFKKDAEEGMRIMQEFMFLSNKMDQIESVRLEDNKRNISFLNVLTSYYLRLILILSILFQIISFIIIINAFKRRRSYQAELENKIKELNLSNSEVEQIAFVASHDLQEPLRKIRTFSNKLEKDYSKVLNVDGQKIVTKMSAASESMQDLLNDFISYTRLIKSTETIKPVDLNKVVQDVLEEHKKAIEHKKATFKIDRLPYVAGYDSQLHLLFSSLVDNALKFSKQDVAAVISITVLKVVEEENSNLKSYFKISFIDNGIGFQKEFAEKIFIIFQRLHTHSSPYLGKGIGLAICRRVMVNHSGFITASGEEGVGATFNLFFPESK